MDTNNTHVLAAQAASSGLIGVNFLIVAAFVIYLIWYERKKADHQWPDMARGAIAVTLLMMCFPALAVALGSGLNTVIDAIWSSVKTIKLDI